MSYSPPKTKKKDRLISYRPSRAVSIRNLEPCGLHTHLLFFHTFIPASFISDDVAEGGQRVPPGIAVIRPVKLGTPYLDYLRETEEEDTFDPFVEFGYPVLEIRVALQVETVDLRNGMNK